MKFLRSNQRLSLLAAALLCLFTTAQGQDFWSNGIHYNLTEDNTAEVTYMDYYYDYWGGGDQYNSDDSYSGDIVIPSTVTAWVYPQYEMPYEVTVTVTAIGYHAFHDCYDLTSVTLPNTIKLIDYSAFYNCSSLTSIDLPDGLMTIQESAFEKSGLTSIDIPSSVTDLGWNAFYGCESLVEATVPSSITSLHGTFSWCTALKTVHLPNTITSLYNTFSGCSSLEEIILPESVTTMQNTFSNCTQLLNITCWPMTPPTANSSSFDSSIYELATLHVPSVVIDNYKAANVWCNFTNIVAIGGGDIIPGDVDGDGEIGIADVAGLIDLIMAHATVNDCPGADVDDDGEIGISDLAELIDRILAHA